MTIQNNSTMQEAEVLNMRSALEHRATWMYFLIDEARKNSPDWEEMARHAIRRCGVFHGNNKFSCTDDLKAFTDQFANELVRRIFEMDVKELTQDRLVLEFNYCPLVAAWLKLGVSETEVKTLCDIAMEGDRGIADVFSDFTFELGDTIAKGGRCCEIVFTRKK